MLGPYLKGAQVRQLRRVVAALDVATVLLGLLLWWLLG